MEDNEAGGIFAIMSFGVLITVVLFKFTPLGTMFVGGITGATVGFILFAVVFALTLLIIVASIADRNH
jgi:hypothetical protein